MEFKDFRKSLKEIETIVRFETKLEELYIDYPNMSMVAAKLLEHSVTGVFTDDGLITWWLYALDCGKESGDLFAPDGSTIKIQSAEDLWNVLTNDFPLYLKLVGECWEQMEIELEE